jgi:hypothetical protein
MSVFELTVHGVRKLRIVNPTKLTRVAASDLIIDTDQGEIRVCLFSSAAADDLGMEQVSSVAFAAKQAEVTK